MEPAERAREQAVQMQSSAVCSLASAVCCSIQAKKRTRVGLD